MLSSSQLIHFRSVFTSSFENWSSWYSYSYSAQIVLVSPKDLDEFFCRSTAGTVAPSASAAGQLFHSKGHLLQKVVTFVCVSVPTLFPAFIFFFPKRKRGKKGDRKKVVIISIGLSMVKEKLTSNIGLFLSKSSSWDTAIQIRNSTQLRLDYPLFWIQFIIPFK